jgi:hypothetical protein
MPMPSALLVDRLRRRLRRSVGSGIYRYALTNLGTARAAISRGRYSVTRHPRALICCLAASLA